MKCVIMAGGKGSRLLGLNLEIPKPMVTIDNKPILEHEISVLKKFGILDFIITVGYMSNKIIDYFGDGKKLGVSIKYYIEKQPLGNAGALFKLQKDLKEDFLLINGDALFDIDINRFISFHKSHKGYVSLFVHPNDHPYDSGIIVSDIDGKVIKWISKEEERPLFYHNCVNAGVHILKPEVLDLDIDGEKVDLDRQVLKPLVSEGKLYAYQSPEYIKDMGTPERYKQVENDYYKGTIHKKNLSNMQRAIFLDRDGVINKYVGFLTDINEFELLPDVAKAIKKANASGFLVIVVTNQPVIARGEVSYEELEDIHKKMETLLGEQGAYLDAVFFCPHHPQKGFEGEIKELKIECDCRKPKPGMLFEAQKKFNIDLCKSWMVGDSNNDILAGKAAGCHTLLVSLEEMDCGQDKVATDLLEAVDVILEEENDE